VNRALAAEGAVGLGHHERRAAHALHAAGHQQFGFSGADRARSRAHRIEPGTAETGDRHARHLQRQTGHQGQQAGHVALVLASLVGAAGQHIAGCLPVSPVLRDVCAFNGIAPRSSARTDDKAPPQRPKW
jgi:hypothetical protein